MSLPLVHFCRFAGPPTFVLDGQLGRKAVSRSFTGISLTENARSSCLGRDFLFVGFNLFYVVCKKGLSSGGLAMFCIHIFEPRGIVQYLEVRVNHKTHLQLHL